MALNAFHFTSLCVLRVILLALIDMTLPVLVCVRDDRFLPPSGSLVTPGTPRRRYIVRCIRDFGDTEVSWSGFFLIRRWAYALPISSTESPSLGIDPSAPGGRKDTGAQV